jgi:hypothetical protein
MNLPGFTAEASLFNASTSYQATAEATVYGGLVQPAQGSGVFNPDQPVLGVFDFFSPYLLCWQRRCFYESHVGRVCLWVNTCY